MSEAPRFAYPPRRLRVEEAARYVGLSKSEFLTRDIPCVRDGRTVGWLIEDLNAYLDALSGRAQAAAVSSDPFVTP